MASTELRRKARKNRVVSKMRQDNIKRLTRKPVLKLIDIEKIKEEFAAKAANKKKTAKKPADTAAKKAEVKETAAETKVVKDAAEETSTPVAEKKSAPKAEEKKAADTKKEYKA